MDLNTIDFTNPANLADLQAQADQLRQRQQLAQSFLTPSYVPNSGKMGVLGSVLSSITGAILKHRNDQKVSDILRQEFEAQNQQSAAAQKQKIADEMRKMQEDIYKQSQGATATAKAQRDYAKQQFTGGGVFDPSKGTFAPNQDWMNQQLGLKNAEAKIAAANRAPPEIYAKLALAKQMGATPEQLKAMVTGAAGNENGMPIALPQPSGATGEDYIKQLAPTDQAAVRMLGQYRMDIPKGSALRSPYWQSLFQAAAQAYPNFDPAQYGARAKTLNAFKGAGTEAQQINSLQTMAEHANQLMQTYKTLPHPTGMPAVDNMIQGAEYNLGHAKGLNAYRQNALTLADEVQKLWKKGSATESEIQELKKNLSSSQNPDQMQQTVAGLVGLVHGKLGSLKQQYVQGMGGDQALQFLDPETQKILSNLDPENAPSFAKNATAPFSGDIASGKQTPQTKTIGGKTYVNVNGQWFQQ